MKPEPSPRRGTSERRRVDLAFLGRLAVLDHVDVDDRRVDRATTSAKDGAEPKSPGGADGRADAGRRRPPGSPSEPATKATRTSDEHEARRGS